MKKIRRLGNQPLCNLKSCWGEYESAFFSEGKTRHTLHLSNIGVTRLDVGDLLLIGSTCCTYVLEAKQIHQVLDVNILNREIRSTLFTFCTLQFATLNTDTVCHYNFLLNKLEVQMQGKIVYYTIYKINKWNLWHIVHRRNSKNSIDIAHCILEKLMSKQNHWDLLFLSNVESEIDLYVSRCDRYLSGIFRKPLRSTSKEEVNFECGVIMYHCISFIVKLRYSFDSCQPIRLCWYRTQKNEQVQIEQIFHWSVCLFHLNPKINSF